MNKKNREFFLSSWAIENKTIIYILMVIFLISGITAYNTMPREPFPEINTTESKPPVIRLDPEQNTLFKNTNFEVKQN